MYGWLPFWPRTAAVNADVVNALFIAELAICVLIVLTVVGLMFRFCLVYRRGSSASRANPIAKSWEWEIG
jgi:heme/copper-type cytochrome/quinol oxidase subunit 2